MKALRFLCVAVLFSFFVMPSANAQGQVTTNCDVLWVDWVPCADEPVTGEALGCLKMWDNGKTQQSWKGTFIGVDSGKEYTFSRVQNDNKLMYKEGAAFHYQVVSSGSVECEGVVIGSYHMTWRATWNANGELVNEVHKGEWWFDCL